SITRNSVQIEIKRNFITLQNLHEAKIQFLHLINRIARIVAGKIDSYLIVVDRCGGGLHFIALLANNMVR
ncbi:MAG TPA: hypothetical protein PKX60_05535, partial [Prolixibacteraceae bacterium]|nr:hypothetical protein [Prolixibacteraceae bacterium]